MFKLQNVGAAKSFIWTHGQFQSSIWTCVSAGSCVVWLVSVLVGGERKILADVSSCRSTGQDKLDGHYALNKAYKELPGY
jgi:hypothetical protein